MRRLEGQILGLVGYSAIPTRKKGDVADLHGMASADSADHARHRIRVSAAIERCAGVIDIDTLQGGRKAVRVALAAHLAIGNDVQTCALLIANREDRGVVLRLLQPLGAPTVSA